MAVKVASFRLTRGFFTDTPAGLAPADGWTSGSNFVFEHGVARRVRGSTAAAGTNFPPASAPVEHFREAETHFYSGGYAFDFQLLGLFKSAGIWKVGRFDGSYTDQTPGGWGSNGLYVTSDKYASAYAIFNVDDERPVYGLISGLVVTLPGWGPSGSASDRCVCIRAWKDHVFALNFYDATAALWRASGVYWSGAGSATAFPTVWVPAATNLAGNSFLGGDGGPIWDGQPLRDSFLIYRRNAIWQMDRVTGDAVFAVRPLFRNIGVIGINCVATDGQSHYFFDGKDLFQTDGQRWGSVLTGKVRGQISMGTPGFVSVYRTCVHYRPGTKEVWACYSSGGETPTLDRAVVYNVETGDAALRTFEAGHYWFENIYGSATAPTYLAETWGFTVSDKFLRMETGINDTGTSITASITRDHLDFGKPERRKLVQWVRPIIYPASGSPVLSCEVGARDTIGGTPTYSTAVNFTHGTSDKADTFANGRFLSFRFGSTGDYDYSIAGFDVGYELEGEH